MMGDCSQNYFQSFLQDQYELVHRAVAWLFRKELGLPPNPKDFGHLYENVKLQAEVKQNYALATINEFNQWTLYAQCTGHNSQPMIGLH